MRRMMILIVGMLVCAAWANASTNAPPYTNGQFYVWSATNAVTATNALSYINGAGWFPITGKNAKTGKLEPDKQKTINWADEVQERVDGKRCFSRIPEKVLDAVGVSAAQRQLFFTTFSPDVEEYQSDWFPEPESPEGP